MKNMNSSRYYTSLPPEFKVALTDFFYRHIQKAPPYLPNSEFEYEWVSNKLKEEGFNLYNLGVLLTRDLEV